MEPQFICWGSMSSTDDRVKPVLIDGWVFYVVQLVKDVSARIHLFLLMILLEFGFHCCSADEACFYEDPYVSFSFCDTIGIRFLLTSFWPIYDDGGNCLMVYDEYLIPQYALYIISLPVCRSTISRDVVK